MRYAIVYLLLTVCGAASTQDAMANGTCPGEHTATTDFNYTGLLLTERGSCTAVLLPVEFTERYGNTYIITAAHCVARNAFFLTDRSFMRVQRFERIRAGCNEPDLAVGVLPSQPWEVPTSLSLRIPDAPLADEPGLDLTVVGYGKKSCETEYTYPLRKAGSMTMLGYNRSKLGRRYSSTVIELVPSERSGAAVCPGDSGGPVLDGNTLVGITSASIGFKPPTLVCVNESYRATTARRLPGYRLRSGMLFPPRRQTRRLPGYLQSITAGLGLHNSALSGYPVAEEFCRRLNDPHEFRTFVEDIEEGKHSNSYFRSFRRLAAGLRGWRLPTTAEVAALSIHNSDPHHLKNAIAASPRMRGLIWTADGQDSARMAATLNGTVLMLPDLPKQCDLQIMSEAVSIFHYLDNIHAALQRAAL